MDLKRTPAGACLAALLCACMARGHADDPKARFLANPLPPVVFDEPGGVASGDFSDSVELMAHLAPGDFGTEAPFASDCWGYTSSIGREYAIVGLRNAVAFVDITTPDAPVIIETHEWTTCIWYDVKTYGSYAYVVNDCASDMLIFDLSQIDLGMVSLANTITDSPSDSHNVAIDTASGFLYRAGGTNQGLVIYDLNQDCCNPPQVATWSDRYVHDAWPHTYTSGTYAGREIVICNGGFNNGNVEPGIDVLDVTDKDDIILLDRYLYPGADYSHQGCLSDDAQIYYMGDEQDGGPTTTYMIDMSDLENLDLIGTFSNGEAATDHNQYVRGRYIFQSNYSTGLRIFDAVDPAAPVEVASFDTYPSDDGPGFGGLWSNYPYFASGTVIGSGSGGLWVWDVGLGGPCDGDVNEDGTVDVDDLTNVIINWGVCVECAADVTGDDRVTVDDLVEIVLAWGPC